MINRRSDFRSGQRGYLLEIPLIVMATLVLMSIIIPAAPIWVGKIVAGVGAIILLWGCHYMMLTPGWQPESRRMRYPWNIVSFVGTAAVIIAAAGTFIFLR